MLRVALILACASATLAAAQQYSRDSEGYLVHFTGDRVDPDTCLLWNPASRTFRRPLSLAQPDGSMLVLAPGTAFTSVPGTCSLYTELGIDTTTLVPPAFRPPALTDGGVAPVVTVAAAPPGFAPAVAPVIAPGIGPFITVPVGAPAPVLTPVPVPGPIPALAPAPIVAPVPVAPSPAVPAVAPVATSLAAPAVRVPSPGSL